MHTRAQPKGEGPRGLEKAGSGQKYSNFRKTWAEQLRMFKIGVTLLLSLAEKGRLGLHDLTYKYLSRALVKTLSPTR